MPSARSELEALLRSLLDESELRALFSRLDVTGDLAAALPGRETSFERLCHEAAAVLDRRGGVDATLFLELSRRAGSRAGHVAAVARQFGVELSSPPTGSGANARRVRPFDRRLVAAGLLLAVAAGGVTIRAIACGEPGSDGRPDERPTGAATTEETRLLVKRGLLELLPAVRTKCAAFVGGARRLKVRISTEDVPSRVVADVQDPYTMTELGMCVAEAIESKLGVIVGGAGPSPPVSVDIDVIAGSAEFR